MNARKIHLTIAWLIFATCVMFVAIWQVKRSLDQEHLARHATLGPPGKTKSGRVLVLSADRDPRAAYVDACAKGLSIQQIRWILDDFRDAGLEVNGRMQPSETDRDFLRGAAAHRWYHRSLVHALGLSREQSDKAARSLSALFSERVSQQRLAPFDWFYNRADPYSNPMDSPYQPWRLCLLEPRQADITWQDGNRPPRSDTDADATWIMNNLEPSAIRTLLRGPDDIIDIPQDFPMWAHEVNIVFPLLESQKFESESFGLEMDPDGPTAPALIGNIRKLHASQLMFLLLVHPDYAADIRSLLEE